MKVPDGVMFRAVEWCEVCRYIPNSPEKEPCPNCTVIDAQNAQELKDKVEALIASRKDV